MQSKHGVSISKKKRKFKLEIEAYGSITNGMIRLKIEGLNSTFDRYRKYIVFGLRYSKVSSRSTKPNTASDSKFQNIYGRNLLYRPSRHLLIKVDTDLYDYTMTMRLGMYISKSSRFPDTIDNIKILKSTWFGYSNTIHITIPSQMNMKPTTIFNLNDWILFKVSDSYRWRVGEIRDMKTTEEQKLYRISYKNERIYDDVEEVRYISVYRYLNLANTLEADKCLIIGERMDIDDESVMSLYLLLFDVFLRKYAYKCMNSRDVDDADFESMAKCVAVNVIDCLWVKKNNGYKIRCMYENLEPHYETNLKLWIDRKLHIGKAGEKKDVKKAQHSIHVCDMCLCYDGIYCWIFKCREKKESAYYGHDLCVTCIYSMIKKYNQLHSLLIDLLIKELTADCIQCIAVFVAGNVVKI
eukprot:76904_1